MRQEECRDNMFGVMKETGDTVIIYDCYEDGNAEYDLVLKDTWPYGGEEMYDDISMFDPYPYAKIDANTFSKLLRYELKIEDVMPNGEFFPAYAVNGRCENPAEDILTGLKKLADNENPAEIMEFMRWFQNISYNYDALGFDSSTDYTLHIQNMDDREMLLAAVSHLYDVYDSYLWEYERDGKILPELFAEVIEEFELLVRNWGKPFEKREFSINALRKFIYGNREEDLEKMDVIQKDKYRKCMDMLCEVMPQALQKKGYMIYSGNAIYDQNWPLCRDIFEEYYKKTADASAMNTLGYIYYYGRCNGGVGEYEKAFRCFSIGHAFGYYESTYKLGDMFSHGFGVEKSGDTAANLYWMVYNDSIKKFVRGEFDGQFADAALRIGNCYKNGIGESKNENLALYYYLQADLAIRKRIENGDYYGDTNVFTGIQKSLAELLSDRKIRRSVKSLTPFVLYDILDGARRIKVKVKEGKDSSYRLEASYMNIPNEYRIPYIFLTNAETGYSGLVEKAVMKTLNNASVELMDGGSEFIYNHIEDRRGVWYFYHDEKLTAKIKTDGFVFKAPASRKTGDGETIMMVSVRFSTNGRTYDYICEDETVKAGDRVIVNGYEGETEVEVVSVARKSEAELFIPLERYKKIVRKA